MFTYQSIANKNLVQEFSSTDHCMRTPFSYFFNLLYIQVIFFYFQHGNYDLF